MTDDTSTRILTEIAARTGLTHTQIADHFRTGDQFVIDRDHPQGHWV